MYDLVIAEKLAKVEMLKESKLWSPKFTPTLFKRAFVYPMLAITGFCLYLHFYRYPQKMLDMKRRKGIILPEMEAMGFLKDWVVEEYKDEIYSDEVLRELEIMTNSTPEKRLTKPTLADDVKNLMETRVATDKVKMQTKLNDLYTKRKNIKLD